VKVRLLGLTPSNPVCYVDTIAKSGDPGTLTYPCSGDGAARIEFSGGTLEGEVKGGILSTCTGTEFPWSDGCDWTSAQHASGPVPKGPFRFDYAEAPKPGQSGCTWSCSATGTIVVE
jgi:hypothetical protein